MPDYYTEWLLIASILFKKRHQISEPLSLRKENLLAFKPLAMKGRDQHLCQTELLKTKQSRVLSHSLETAMRCRDLCL